MKKLTLLVIIVFYTIISFAQSTVDGNYSFYTDGGDTLQFTIKNSKLYLIDDVVLNYQSSKKNFYLNKIIDPEVYKHEVYYSKYKEEYIIVPVYASGQLVSVSLTVKTYFGKNRLINSYTKRFSKTGKKLGKFVLGYKLVKAYKNYAAYCGPGFDKNILKDTVENEEDEGVYIEPKINFELIQNNDGTLTIYPGSFCYYINGKSDNKFFGSSEFGSCLLDYSYTCIKKSGEKMLDLFLYSAGGAATITCGKYKLVNKRKIEPILFNNVLSGKFSEDMGY